MAGVVSLRAATSGHSFPAVACSRIAAAFIRTRHWLLPRPTCRLFASRNGILMETKATSLHSGIYYWNPTRVVELESVECSRVEFRSNAPVLIDLFYRTIVAFQLSLANIFHGKRVCYFLCSFVCFYPALFFISVL